MIHKILIATAGALALASTASTAASDTLPVEWTISPRSGGAADIVQLALTYRIGSGHSMNSGPQPLGDLQGLTGAQLSSAEGVPANFRILREAGNFDCRGVVREWSGAGQCTFLPDPAFAAALERRGVGRPGIRDQYQLAVANVGTPVIDELDRHGYRKPDVDGLVAAGIHGVTVPYIRSMADAGYRLGDVDELVKFRIHGVSNEYIREMAMLNPPGGRFSADDLVSMRIHGLTASKARDFAALGYRNLGSDDLLAMSIHGVTPDFINQLSAAGFKNLSADELVRMRIHGVTPDYIRDMKAAGYTIPSADQLVRMRISGFRPGRGRD